MKISNQEALCYDDVLISPNYSEIIPSSVNVSTKLTKNLDLKIPILSAAMDTVTESKMAIAMAEAGGIGIVHKNLSIEEQALQVKEVSSKGLIVGAACGVSENEFKRAQSLVESGVSVLIIDTAHGHSKGVIDQVKRIKEALPVELIAGNIATKRAAEDLVKAGVDAVKIGIGPGSICTTRVIAGIGVPQFQAILDVSDFLRKEGIPFIADGGIRHSGDIVKALAAGASTVMLGSLLAATDEAASETINHEGKIYKRYRGMGSLTAMNMGSKDRYAQSDISSKDKLVPEGVEGIIPSKGETSDFLYQLVGGLKSGMGYVGAENLENLHERAEFIRVSSASFRENHPHNIVLEVKAPNY